LAQFPAAGETRQLRQTPGIAFLVTLTLPRGQGGNLAVGQTTFITKSGVAHLGTPGRHVTAFRKFHNLLAAFPCVFVGQERERRNLAWPMATRTILKQDRRDMFGERHSGRARRWTGGGNQPAMGEKNKHHQGGVEGGKSWARHRELSWLLLVGASGI